MKTEPACYLVMPAAAQGRAITPLDVPLPPGCQLDGHVPGEADAFGVLYQNPDGHLGATIWDGFASQVGTCPVIKDRCKSALGAVCLHGRAGCHLKKHVEWRYLWACFVFARQKREQVQS